MPRRNLDENTRGPKPRNLSVVGAMLGCFCVGLLSCYGQVARADEPSKSAEATRWVSVGKDVIEDTRTGLQWTQADNGSDINWKDAGSWCVSKRFHWRLPTLQELLSIYIDPATGSGGVACGQATCQAYVEFKLSGSWFWSSTPVGKDAYDGIELAWGVQLINGSRTQSVMGLPDGARALCVRNH